MTQVRAIIVGLIILAAVIVGGGLWWNAKRTAALKARVVVAEQVAELAVQTTGIVERVVRSEITIRTQAERQTHAVQIAPGADAALDPAFTATLRGSIGIMRGESQAADDSGSAATP